MKIIKNQNSFKYKKINYLDYKLFSNQIILKFNDLCEIVRGGSPRPIQEYITNSENDTPWLKIRDATSVCKYIEKTKEFIKKDGEKYSRIVNPGDFIVSNSATPGIPRIMNIRACIHDGWLLLNNINEKIIKKDYMFYMFYMIKHQLENQGQGSIFKNLSKDILGNFEIKINVDIKQQERIAHILSMQEEQIERIKGLIKKLEKRNQYYAEKLLSGELRIRENAGTGKFEFYENEEWQEVVLNGKQCKVPIKWIIKKIEENIIELPKSKIKTGDAKKCNNGEYPFFNCSENQTLTYNNFISDEEIILLSTGGKASVNYMNGKCAYSTDVYAIKFKEINNNFAFNYIKSKIKEVEKTFKGSALKHLNKKDFKKLEILIPMPKEQDNISNIIINLNEELEKIKQILTKEEKRFQWMLDNLLSGEYEVVEN